MYVSLKKSGSKEERNISQSREKDYYYNYRIVYVAYISVSEFLKREKEGRSSYQSARKNYDNIRLRCKFS